MLFLNIRNKINNGLDVKKVLHLVCIMLHLRGGKGV